jgi:hypothetical protein
MRRVLASIPVSSAVKASLEVQDITYTALLRGVAGNDITIQYADTATAGSETVTVTDNAILIGIESGVSTATQVKAAFDAESDATDLASAAITGTAGTAQVTAAAASLASGTNIAASGIDASQITSVTETAVGTWLIILKYPYQPNSLAGDPIAMAMSKTAGAQALISAVDHDRITVKAYDTTDGSTLVDCNFDLDVTGNDGRILY